MLKGMETEPLTPDETAALRRNQKQRLKDQAEALLKAYEALESPQTYAEADRAAKALMSINKALDQMHGPEPETTDAPKTGALEHTITSEALKPVYANVYRRLGQIDARLGRPSEYARLADNLEAEMAAASSSP
jgi:hypothetical protein